MRRLRFAVSALALLFGVLLSIQYRSQVEVRTRMPSRRLEDLAVLLKGAERANAQLTEQVNTLQARLGSGTQTTGSGSETSWGAQDPVSGPGIVLRISERARLSDLEEMSSAVVHAEDLLKIINELRTGGAEIICLNGTRLTELSEVVNAGAHIMVNGNAVGSPYRIAAIGPFEEMKKCLSLRGGVTEYLQFYGITVAMESVKRLDLPAAPQTRPMRYARPEQANALGSAGTI